MDISGYEYDVFISYRQKDNKYDGWVTEFVDNLKKELEATFKEDIRVYFDINPHDGLLETHDVDASLRDKLKCLVFIPVISRTYCDPRSFAWEHEFRAFIHLASKDQYGVKVKLGSGNVAGRILPIQIHDLRDEDKLLLEKELGGPLRSVDFIYKESGVNRPLTPDDDEKKNINRTKYRNQINKLANAIDEIIHAIKSANNESGQEKIANTDSRSGIYQNRSRTEHNRSGKLKKIKLISGGAILVALIIAALIAYPKIFRDRSIEELRSSGKRISVAVMPFQNMTNDTTLNIWQDGIQFGLVSFLSSSADLKVRKTESTNYLLHSKGIVDYALITPTIAKTISQNLDASVFIFGNISAAGGKIRLSAQLIDSKTEEVFKSFQVDGEAIKMMVIGDSLASLVKNFLVISVYKKEISREFQTLAPNSVEAFKAFILGYKAFFRFDNLSAIKSFSQAIEIDSNYVSAYIWLALSYANEGLFNQAEKSCRKVYEKKEVLPFDLRIWADLLYARYHEKSIYEEIKYAKQLLEIDDRLALNHWAVALPYYELEQYNNAIPELEATLKLFKSWNTKPMNSGFYQTLIESYHATGKHKEEKKLLKEAITDFPADPGLTRSLIKLSLSEGDTVKANQQIRDYISLSRDNTISEAAINRDLGDLYYSTGIIDKAETYYRRALLIDPANPSRLNDMANFLFNTNKNLDEGLSLIDKALAIDPDKYYYLDTKGWGLYKLGRYEESIKFLEKSDSLKPVYRHEIFLHIQEVKKAIASQK